MSDFDRHSRVDKFEKRRKNTKYISTLLITGSVLLVVLFGIWIFGGGDNDMADSDDSPSDENTANNDEIIIEDKSDEETEDTDVNENDENSEDADEDEEDNSELNGDVEIEEVDSNDGNVIAAYTGNWQPVGTEQEGPHTTDYSDGSQDRIEIEEAVIYATGLNENDITTHWVGNDGDQRVVATVSDGDHTEIYRVFLSWIDGEGWQPTKVEELEEVDV
ncbi:YrrS family protein [Virgibacillus sp. YIM 98842]|uniref:YrrS family protein n=1 Tax=Virgibacillus sp. YIM 98842 TaxID=2663533 RepID=UPI0013DB1270|nr:YrrS family protein [Virgibacillus sp. YIM 98842]